MRAFARAYRNLAREHPHLVRELVSGAAAPATLRAGEPLYATLEAGGFPPATVVRAADLVVDYVNGFALAETGGPTRESRGQAGSSPAAGGVPGRKRTGDAPRLRGAVRGGDARGFRVRAEHTDFGVGVRCKRKTSRQRLVMNRGSEGRRQASGCRWQ